MDFGQPNAEIVWKMANGRLLFLSLNPFYLHDIIFITLGLYASSAFSNKNGIIIIPKFNNTLAYILN